MNNSTDSQTIHDLIDRLTRLTAAEEWNGPLNPSQFAALTYLARANRFSRAPSHVADYLVTTRGTASQTLKALARKDLITEARSEADKRSIRYDVTKDGLALLKDASGLETVVETLPADVAASLAASLKSLVLALLHHRGGRSFGLCGTCRHHEPTATGGHCRLLGVSLKPHEASQLCHEHSPELETHP
ncbi:MarR family winged helix-turn-helix transcriptional regulator [Roseibium sediminicola]|uniref:MarR family transcriptional regulator n=1 Tax=Roseibium sediminicola TaxID=2933272 RepID=A0ABT0GT03_9HYPH|nr:MarR family transcriptional regulator [Roseibium sp. CAU 1639]MCK7612557.1 MarR family transcriptional regulator [Roseibium sp. CAU 1639]